MSFDPLKYLQETEKKSTSFDPNAYLSDEVDTKQDIDKFSVFGFLNPENPDEYQKNMQNFFDIEKDLAVIKLQKLIGDSYKIEGAGVTFKDFFDPKGNKNTNRVRITKKGTNDSIEIDFGVAGIATTVDREKIYKKSSQDLFSFLSKTMSNEDILKAEQAQKDVSKQYRKYTNPGGSLHVSIDEKNKATEKFDADDLFKTTTQTRTVYDGSISRNITTEIKPYEKELESAKQALIRQGIENPTEEQIQNIVINDLKQKAVQDIFDKKANKFMNSDEVEETDLDAILKLGAQLSKKETFQNKKKIAESKIKLESSIDKFENDANDTLSDVYRANQFLKILESTEAVDLEVDSNEQLVELKNGTIMSKSDYDSYVASVVKAQNQYQKIDNLQNKLLQDIENVQDAEAQADLIGRNYNDLEKFFYNIGTGFGRIITSGTYGISKMQSGIFGVDNEILDKEFLKIQEAQNIYRDKFQKDVKFEDAFNSLESFGRFVSQEAGHQIPIFATLAIPGVGIPALGLSSSGDRWSEIVQEDKATGNETGLFNKLMQSAGYGAAEIVFDRYLTLPVLQRSASLMFKKGGRDVVEGSIYNYFKANAARQLAYTPIIESSAEGLTTISQNIISGRPLTENLAHSAFSGLMFGGVFGGAPFTKGLVMQKFGDYSNYEGYRTNLKNITDFETTLKKLNISLKANKTKGNDTTNLESSIDFVTNEINRLKAENENILKDVDKKTSNLSKKWFNIYNDATVEQEKIRIEVENILEDKNLSNKQKQLLVNSAKARFDQFQKTRDVLRDEKNFGNAYAGFRNSNKKEDTVRLEEIMSQATTELINEGKTQPTDDDIDNRSRIIFNKQEINKDYNSKKKEILKVFKNFKSFQTVDEVINFIDTMNISEADKQDLKNNFEEGAHGVNVVDLEGEITPIQVVDNMAKADRLETRTHELGHAFLAAAFGNNKESFDGIADDVLNFVKERDENLHILLVNKVQRDQQGNLISEEVITEFLELAAEGKFNNDTKGLSFFANLLNLGTKESLGQDVDLNFDGETDAVNFLINLGKKLKAGTITLKDIASIKEAVQIEKDIKTDPKITFSKDASDKVQEIYKDKGTDGAFEIINEFKPIVSRIAEKRRGAPNFDKELLMSEIEIGERGILDLIKDYKPESGVPLAAYINKFLPARAIEASRRVLGEEFTQDVTEARTVEAREETTTETKPQRKKIVLADRLGVTDKVGKAIQKIIPSLDINKLNFKNLKNQIPDITGELFGIAPKKIKNLANLTKKELQSAQMFINKNADLLIAMLPEGATASGTATGVPNTLLKAFYTKTDRAKMAKTGSRAGLAIQEKNNINKKDFLEVFGIVDGKPDRTDRNTSARVLALANLTGKMITNQAVRQSLGEIDVKAKENVARIKDGKSSIMFSGKSEKLADPLENFQLTYEHDLGILSEALYGKNIRIPNHKEGALKGTRNLEAIFDEKTGETYREAAIRVVNTFLKSHPQYRNLIRSTMTGGKKGGLFKFANSNDKNFIKYKERTGDDINFDDNIVNYPDVEQVGKKQSYNKNEKYSEDFHKKINTDEFKKENSKKLQELLGFFEAIEAHLQNFKSDIWLFEEMLLDTSKHMNTVTRILAPITFYPVDKDGIPIFDKRAVEEHTDPQNLIGKALLAGAFFNKLNDVWKVVGKSYMQGSILKVDDPSGDLKANMPSSYYESVVPRLLNGDLKLPNGYSSIIRLAESGIDPNAYMLINENQTIAEYFKVSGLPVKQANDIIIKKLTGELDFDFEQRIQYPENYNENKTYSEVSLKGNVVTNYSKSKGMSTFDFDETLIVDGKNFVVAIEPETGKRIKISSANWPVEGPKFTEQGYTFDFSDFVKVRGGKEGPLLQKMRNQIKKYGPNNVFVLTARPQQSADAINGWLQSKGIKIPFKNITGLGNSTGEAKAMWMLEKFNEGYNDMYFVDDAMSNVAAVKNVLDQLDIKSKVVQAKIQFSKDMNKTFNNNLDSNVESELDINKIIEQTTGVKAEARFSEAQAKIRGSKKGKFGFFVPPSAEDFKGLIYRFLGKGKTGEQQLEFFKKSLFDPFNRAYQRMNADRQSLESGYRALLKQFPKIKSKLNKQIGNNFTLDQAVRIYLFNKAGFEVPGLSKRDLNFVKKYFKDNSEAKSFAESLGNLTNQPDGYLQPTEFWLAETTASDINKINVEISRDEALQEFKQNREKIFGKWQGSKLVGDNINKIEAIYGTRFKEALEDMLYRMEYGRRRETGNNRLVNAFNNWANQSVGAIMFFNMRSALLQTISSVNYLNWSDNNPLKAGAALANFPQFVKDFTMIFNSDLLKQRRGGQQRGINEAELAESIAGSKNKAKAMLHWLLTKGFLPTQIADSFAIASGGALMYRNRVKSYLKQGLSQSEAESKAFNDFQEITEEGQQSARPDMISQQQASPLGRYILAFKNTPMQYARLMKKAILDLANNRGDFKSNVSKIIYYGAVQNLIFNGLQAALGSLIGDDEDEEQKTKKQERIINGMIDSVLGGLGFAGNVAVTVKNSLMEYLRQRNKDWGTDHTYTMLSIASLSPTIGSKLRRIYTGIQTERFNRDVIKEMGVFNIDNPAYGAIANVISGATNIPLDRLVKKVDNIDAALTENITPLERLALIMGWNTWDLGIEDQDIISVENEIKARKDKERKEKQKKKREESKIIRQEKNKKQEEENIKKKDGRCVAITSSGERCSNDAVEGNYCTIHVKVAQRNDGKKVQCKHTKADGKRCKMKTSNKSGFCYYHD